MYKNLIYIGFGAQLKYEYEKNFLYIEKTI